MDLGGWREKRRSAADLLVSLVRVACTFPGSAYWCWVLGKNSGYGVGFGGVDLCDPLEMGAGEEVDETRGLDLEAWKEG